MAELTIYEGPAERLRVQLYPRRMTIGRGPTNDLVIPHPRVSDQEFSIEPQGEEWLLRDLSGRGTSVCDELVNESVLEDGAYLKVGPWMVVFTPHCRSRGDDEEASAHAITALKPHDQAEKPSSVQLEIAGPKGECMIPLVGGDAVFGASRSASVRIEDDFVSRKHAQLAQEGDAYRLRDLGSSNGVFVGPMRVFDVVIYPGQSFRLGDTTVTLRPASQGGDQGVFEKMVGRDPALRGIRDQITRVAPTKVAVAVFGETGTGKELVARALHACSDRASKPFIVVNCSTLQKDLAPSELFGHEKGSFTGADRAHVGAFEKADGGTLFLDEVADLGLEVQAMLLRALDSGEVRRVGASEPLQVDARIVCATHKDLPALVARGHFREDLFYRLTVVTLHVPPLRARKGDVALLIKHFLEVNGPALYAAPLSPEAEKKLLEHSWPGNVRELKNVLHSSMLLGHRDLIRAEDIKFERPCLAPPFTSEAPDAQAPSADEPHLIDVRGKTMVAIQQEVVLKAYHRNGGRVSGVAQELGVATNTVYRWLERLGMHEAQAGEEAERAKAKPMQRRPAGGRGNDLEGSGR